MMYTNLVYVDVCVCEFSIYDEYLYDFIGLLIFPKCIKSVNSKFDATMFLGTIYKIIQIQSNK